KLRARVADVRTERRNREAAGSRNVKKEPSMSSLKRNLATAAAGALTALLVLNLAQANGCCSAVNIYADASAAFSYSGNATAGGAYSVRAAELVRGKW